MLLTLAALQTALLSGGDRTIPVVAAPPPQPASARPLAHLLFVDRTHIKSSDARLQLRLQQPTKGPWVLTPTEPWEAWSIGAYNSVVAGDGSRPHRLYYDCVSAPREPQHVCLAESHDGISWHKPSLGLYAFQNSTDNNIVLGAVGCTPFIDTKPGVAAVEAWKMVCSDAEGARGTVFTSPDGLGWRPLPDIKPLSCTGHPVGPCDDTQPTASWDPALKRYVIYIRVNIGAHDAGNRRHVGRCITPNISDWESERPCEVVFGADSQDPPRLDVYTNAHISYPSAEHTAAHLFFPSFFRHFAGTDAHGGPPNGLSNDGLLDTRLVVARDQRSNLSYPADGARSPFVALGINRCHGWSPSQPGGWCSPTVSTQENFLRAFLTLFEIPARVNA